MQNIGGVILEVGEGVYTKAQYFTVQVCARGGLR